MYPSFTSNIAELAMLGFAGTVRSNPAPVLSPLIISATTATDITLAQPVLSNAGTPPVTLEAFIGLSGTISLSGSIVNGALQGQ